MTDPVTMIAMAGSVLGGLANFSAGQFRARIATMNREVALENADRAIARSQVEQMDQDTQTAALIGEQEALQGASGLSLTSRSHIRTRASARTLGRVDALNVRQAGEIESYNYQVDAENFRAEASASQSEALFGLVEGFLGAGSAFAGSKAGESLIGGLTSTKRKLTPPIPATRPTSLSLLR